MPDLVSRQLIEAAESGHVDRLRKLLKDPDVDPAADDNDAIRSAAYNGHVEAVRELLRDGRAEIPADNHSYAIRFAAANGHVEVVRERPRTESLRQTRPIITVGALDDQNTGGGLSGPCGRNANAKRENRRP